MFWISKNSKSKTLITRLYQTTGDCFACIYIHLLKFPFLASFTISDSNILIISKKYQRNIKEISKKYQRNIKETNIYLQKQIIFIF
jgi:hypothetical protein